MIKFNKRKETTAICCVYKPECEDMSIDALTKAALRDGKFNLGYHYILRPTGILEKGIDNSFYGDIDAPSYKTSVIVLVTSGYLTDAQKNTLQQLSATLDLPLLE